jgi:hypothetical protein
VLRGRPWNPCDWRGLISTEGVAQAWRRFAVLYLGAPDYACHEKVAYGPASDRRRLMCDIGKVDDLGVLQRPKGDPCLVRAKPLNWRLNYAGRWVPSDADREPHENARSRHQFNNLDVPPPPLDDQPARHREADDDLLEHRDVWSVERHRFAVVSRLQDVLESVLVKQRGPKRLIGEPCNREIDVAHRRASRVGW